MRSWIFFILLSIGSVGVRAQGSSDGRMHLSRPEVRTAVVGVVTAQLAAFRADEWEKAYALAAQTFQNLVQPEAFKTLITRNYSVVWKNTRTEFSMPSDNGRIAVVPVRVFGQGKSEAYNWLLVKEDEGWRITGVVPQRTDGA